MKTTKTIKTLSILLFFALAIVATSCKKDKDGTTGKTGTFSIDGVSYSGETSIQTFSNGNYSILCEQNSPYGLLQITFHNKAEAEAGGTFDVGASIIDTPSGEVSISADASMFHTYENDGPQTISVSGKKITISNVDLVSTGAGTSSITVNSASINF